MPTAQASPLGDTVLPEFSADSDLSGGRLVAVRIEAPQLQAVYVHLIARRNRQFSPQPTALAERIGRRLVPAALNEARAPAG